MFLVNWLASSNLFQRVEGIPQVERQGCADSPVLDKSLTREEELVGEDLLKLYRIKHLWKRVARELGVENAENVQFAVQKEGVEGAETSVAVWHRGSPTIVIPFEYLSRTVLEGESQSHIAGFDTREWDIWSQFIENSPDQVSDMFAYAEGFKQQFSAKKLKKLVGRYAKYLSQIEFEAELAHEFGHVQARHLNPTNGRRLSSRLRSIAAVALPLAATATAAVVSFALSLVTGSIDLLLPLVTGLLAGVGVRAFISDSVLRRSVSYVRKQWEREADAIAATTQRFCEGNVRLYKKDILVSIVKGEGIENVRRRIFNDAEHHPSDASRLQFFLGRLQQHTIPASIARAVHS